MLILNYFFRISAWSHFLLEEEHCTGSQGEKEKSQDAKRKKKVRIINVTCYFNQGTKWRFTHSKYIFLAAMKLEETNWANLKPLQFKLKKILEL